MDEQLVALIESCLREVANHQNVVLQRDLNAETQLFGKDGLFDSLGLVSLVVAVEEAIERAYGLNVTLADQRAMSQERSPFRTIGALADYSVRLIEEARAAA